MSKRSDDLLLEDIINSSKRILKYVNGLSRNEFFDDMKTQDAVVRNFEIIGEAAARFSESLKSDRSEIPWHHLKGYRNRLIHEYFGVDYNIVGTSLEMIYQNSLSNSKIEIAQHSITHPVTYSQTCFYLKK